MKFSLGNMKGKGDMKDLVVNGSILIRTDSET